VRAPFLFEVEEGERVHVFSVRGGSDIGERMVQTEPVLARFPRNHAVT
jgi:hypothetical protein